MDLAPRIALVGSSGGHLAQLLALEPWWRNHRRFWVTFDKPDAHAALAGERAYWCHSPTNRNLFNLVRNTWLAINVLRRERPHLIVSTGAGPAVPFFFVGKLLFNTRTIFIEVVDRVDRPTLTGRIVRPVTDKYVVQWPEQRGLYPKASVIGRLV